MSTLPRRLRVFRSVLLLSFMSGPLQAAAEDFPAWAFPGCDGPPPAAPATAARVSVPGSSVHLTPAEILNWSVTPDWFPQEHPPLPAVLARSKARQIPACGFCHLPDGTGRPENAKLAGLPADYIVAQVKAFHGGERRAAAADYAPAAFMRTSTAELSDAEISAAAQYFAALRARSWLEVIETRDVPAHAASCFVEVPAVGSPTPLGSRILEMPRDVQRFEHRDPHTPYVAYVPLGSIERGRALVSGAGRSMACGVCHGADLKGGAALPGPPLAGRFATYLFRQLVGFQSGARGGAGSTPMRAVVTSLTVADFVDIAAYAASLSP